MARLASSDLRQAPLLGFAGWRRAELALGGDAHAVRKPAAKGLEDHRLAAAIHRGSVEQRDPGIDRMVEGRDRFVGRGFTPSLADAATAKRQPADGPDGPNLLIAWRLSSYASGVHAARRLLFSSSG